MTIKTLTAFIAASHLDSALIKAVVKQSGGWASFQEDAQSIAQHGVDGGFHGWTYYSDTLAFYAKNQALVRNLAKSMADEFGQDTIAMIAGFNCLRNDSTHEEIGETLYGKKAQHDTTVANALAWFACEEVSRAYSDLLESN